MPIEPIDPSKKTGGDGQEKYPAKPKHGPGKFDEILDKAEKAQQARSELSKIAEKTRAEPPYTGKAYSDTGPRTGSNISGTFGPITDPMERKTKPYNKAKGGVVKSLKKAGFYDSGKTQSEREKIVSKATTKPQRIAMVEKLFSAKKMKAGGMASKRADGIAIRGKTRI
jgi:hypothetical protein